LKRQVVKCPMCTDKTMETCNLATVEKVKDETTYVYCCESRAKRDIRE